jgi:hypothetical protein
LFEVAASYDLDEVAVAAAHAQRPAKRGVVLLTSAETAQLPEPTA